MGHLNIGPVYGVRQVEIEHSSETSLFQETKGENLPREWEFRHLVVLCFQSFQGRNLTQMRIGGQRTADFLVAQHQFPLLLEFLSILFES